MIYYITLALLVLNILICLFSRDVWNWVNKKREQGVKLLLANKIVRATYEDRYMTVEYANGKIRQYEGSCTVWRSLPLMERCSTSTEIELSRIWSYIQRWGNDYPNAHQDMESPFQQG